MTPMVPFRVFRLLGYRKMNYYAKLMQIDCVNRKIKDISVIFYDKKGKVIYSSPKSESGEWNDILPDTVGEKLINIVSCETVTSKEAVAAPKIEEPVIPVADAKVKEPSASNEAVATDNSDRVNNRQIETKSASEEAVRLAMSDIPL